MENENEYAQEVAVEQEEQVTEEVAEVVEETHEDEVTISKAELNKLKRKAIAYDSTKSKSEQPKVANTDSPLSEELMDIKILKSQGVKEEHIAYLKKIAKVNGTSLIDAKNDELYQAYVEKQEAEEKARKAAMGASRGAGRKEVQKTTNLTPDEHKEIWRKATGLNA